MRRTDATSDPASLTQEVIDLAPWFFDIEVAQGVRTSVYLDAPPKPDSIKVAVRQRDPIGDRDIDREAFVPPGSVEEDTVVPFYDPSEYFVETLRRIYPNGLEGRSVLDCACNSGAYLFLCKELGAGRCVGFDLRERWIEQAKFLAAHRDAPTDDMEFFVSNLYDVPALGLEPFDIAFFNGIFYHLPNPQTGLQVAADLCKELLIIDTATRRGRPGDSLVATMQPPDHPCGGRYGLRWLPTGPEVLATTAAWLGFAESRCTWWEGRWPVRDRIHMVAARGEGFFDAYDRSLGEGTELMRHVIDTTVRPQTDVLIATGGDTALLDLFQRRGWHFPVAADGSYAPPQSVESALVDLERLRTAGAEYLVVPIPAPDGLETPEFLQALRDRYPVVHRGSSCRIFELTLRDPEPFDPGRALA